MKKEILNKIGSQYCTDNDQNMNTYGNGIGLYTSQMILPMVGPMKKFQIESIYGQGTNFEFLVHQNGQYPINIEINSQNYEKIIQDKYILNPDSPSENIIIQIPKKLRTFQNLDQIQQKTTLQSQKYKVLIVDDDEINFLPIKSFFKKFFYDQFEIITANSGEVALDQYYELNTQKSNENIDLIITDVHMGVMDGYELCANINNLIEIGFRKSYLIIATALCDEEHYIKCRKLKVLTSLEKSVKKKEFVLAIELFLEKVDELNS